MKLLDVILYQLSIYLERAAEDEGLVPLRLGGIAKASIPVCRQLWGAKTSVVG